MLGFADQKQEHFQSDKYKHLAWIAKTAFFKNGMFYEIVLFQNHQVTEASRGWGRRRRGGWGG